MKESFVSALNIVQILSAILVFIIGIGIIAVAIMYVIDRTQTSHAVRRNFPVVGRFRYTFEKMGEYFR
ncbi:MAG: FMN-binding glutamate synthase family protein, partial [Proteobacteria bacterium]|nr:FMN-binding glutamate synthase family protein [Pseudomonadota bacterium]